MTDTSGLPEIHGQIEDGARILNTRTFSERFARRFKKDLPLYILCLPALILLFAFKYFPMYGNIIAFKRFSPRDGFWGSEWVGLKHFISFFSGPYFWRVTRNTLLLGFWSLLITFPAPIVLALLMNELKSQAYKRVIQTISYMPHFISTVIIIGMLKELTSVINGPINDIIAQVGFEKINFFVRPEWFRPMYIGSAVWQGVGFSTIIYLAALAGVDIQLYEASIVDGAGRWKQAIHITLPGIMPTIVILFILSIGQLVSNDFTKILLMYNPATYSTADVIGTYIYRSGLEVSGTGGGSNVSFATAVGLFLSFVSFVLLYVTNKISKSVSDIYLW
ncbi:MAG: sugar ABC transporter permease [Spirochaetales bacterium]|jgi:putative aldouronate transport system permease protein|nr:sugar ABC transporter permease [Spirochaetales bacterium]